MRLLVSNQQRRRLAATDTNYLSSKILLYQQVVGAAGLLVNILTKNQLYVAEKTAGTIVTGYYMGGLF